jgi:colanic acid/amylovoran biosynthesis protein
MTTTPNSSSLPTVAVFGEWSQNNIGDHAIHEGVQDFYGDLGWRVKSFDCGALRASTTPVEKLRAPARAVASLGKTPFGDQLVPIAKRTLRGMRQQILMKRLMPQLAEVDAISVGGGALLTDSNLHFPQSLAELTWAANMLNKPLLCLGCSAEGSWSRRGEEIIRRFVSRCDFIATRDHESAQRISRLLGREIPVFGDFALPVSSLRAIPTWKRRYGLAINVTCVPAPFTLLQDQYEDALVEMVRAALSQTLTARGVALFTTGAAQDVEPAIRVHSRLASLGAELHVGKSLPQLRGIMRSSDVVVAARLHAAIIALAERIPVIGFSATPKIRSFFETVGLEQHSFGLSDSPARVANEVFRVIGGPEQRPSSTRLATLIETRKRTQDYLHALSQERHYPKAASA